MRTPQELVDRLNLLGGPRQPQMKHAEAHVLAKYVAIEELQTRYPEYELSVSEQMAIGRVRGRTTQTRLSGHIKEHIVEASSLLFDHDFAKTGRLQACMGSMRAYVWMHSDELYNRIMAPILRTSSHTESTVAQQVVLVSEFYKRPVMSAVAAMAAGYACRVCWNEGLVACQEAPAESKNVSPVPALV